jgi:hypothetical protein
VPDKREEFIPRRNSRRMEAGIRRALSTPEPCSLSPPARIFTITMKVGKLLSYRLVVLRFVRVKRAV